MARNETKILDAPHSDGPVFIVGVPRSGTTVLSVKLSAAAPIGVLPETHFMSEVYRPLAHMDVSDPKQARHALDIFAKGRWFDALGVTVDDVLVQYEATLNKGWPALFLAVLETYISKTGHIFVGEKTPGHYHWVQEILSWYPKARFIFVVRDPRAVVASNFRAPFAPSYAWFVAKRWVAVWDQYVSMKSNSRVILVRYEDFVDQPDVEIKRVWQELGLKDAFGALIPLDKNLDAASGRRISKSKAKGWRATHLNQANQPVSQKYLTRWKNRLRTADIVEVQNLVGARLLEAGYESDENAKLSFAATVHQKLRYPLERLRLTISAGIKSVRTAERYGRRAGLKPKILNSVGRMSDTVSYGLYRARSVLTFGARGSDARREYSILFLGVPGSSSFVRPSQDDDRVGLLSHAMQEAGYTLGFIASGKAAYQRACRTRQAYGLNHSVPIHYADQKSYASLVTDRLFKGSVSHETAASRVSSVPLDMNILEVTDFVKTIGDKFGGGNDA